MKNTQTTTRSVIAALALTASCISGVNATVLTFDITGFGNGTNIDQSYGDNVIATTMGTFSYGATEGFTPNIGVSYGDTDPAHWTTGYGNLSNVLYEEADFTGILTVTFTADPGFEVVLHEFDLAAYNPSFVSNPTIALIDISSPSGSLFASADVEISETTSTNIDLVPTLQAQELILTIDATNLNGANDSIAIDNIVFSQVAIPEPSSMALIGLGLGLLSRCARR